MVPIEVNLNRIMWEYLTQRNGISAQQRKKGKYFSRRLFKRIVIIPYMAMRIGEHRSRSVTCPLKNKSEPRSFFSLRDNVTEK